MPTITSLPYTISAPGKYILDISGSAVYYNGTPITITANDVCLDMNGCSLINSGGGNNTTNKGIKVTSNLSNIRIKNGTLRGWFYGIHFEDNTYSRDVTIEDMLIQYCTFRGIVATGKYNIIRNCIIENITGCTVYPDAYCMGIECTGQALIENNKIYEIYGVGSIGEGVPISCTDQGVNTVIRNNLIMNRQLANGHTYGIWVGGASVAYCLDNMLFNCDHGITYSSPTQGGYRNNTFVNCTDEYLVHSGIVEI